MRAATGTGAGGEGASSGSFRVKDVLARLAKRDLVSLYNYWEGGASAGAPEDEELMRTHIQAWMVDGALVEARLGELGQRLGSVMENLIHAEGHLSSFAELEGAEALARLSKYDLEACLAALVQRGLLLSGSDRRFESLGQLVYAMPRELASALEACRNQKLRGVFGSLTLRGHLEQEYSAPEKASRISPQRLRGLYKMYSQEAACTSRIERLPDGVRELLEKAVLEFGGILPKELFERMETHLSHWNPRRWKMILEQSLVGTVCELNLQRYGINMHDETFVVFNEVSLAWLRRVAVPGDPDRPHEELSLGIDLVTNVSRFLNYVEQNGVRFTARGEIFKTTEKKIRQYLIPNPGRELSREDVLRFIFRFCKRRGLIDRTAKRTFRVTEEGRAFGSLALLKKQHALLDFMVEERPEERVLFHQRQMRGIFLRMLKRVEPDTWYDLMYLPFLARNNYLSTLDELNVEEHFTERTESGNFQMLEDVQRLAWNLVRWARQGLYLLGVLDIGYDKSGHPVAMRLTKAGTRLLGVDPIGPSIPHAMGALVVTPDFEVVLFPHGRRRGADSRPGPLLRSRQGRLAPALSNLPGGRRACPARWHGTGTHRARARDQLAHAGAPERGLLDSFLGAVRWLDAPGARAAAGRR